jgi:SAM-dependent methyltransferase
VRLYKPLCDVRQFFTQTTTIEIYECLGTGYRFYHPATVSGDSLFYESLSKEALYYIPWKWEHEVTDEYIKNGDTILELGCATGDFLVEEMKRKDIKPFGTELNETARKTAKARGISFAETSTADVTCAFQVLEHISDVRGFLDHAIASTKPNGFLIFGVPNNDCFIKDDPNCFLNMPPHHMGLWTERSLRALAEHFPLEVIDVRTECLQPHHYRYYYQVRFGDYFRRFGFFGKVFNKLVYECLARPYLSLRAPHILGHTIIAIYRKRT